MRKKLDTRFPAARIKKIMQADEDVGKIALAVPVLVSKALELFLQDLCDRTYEITLQRGAKTMSALHLKHCVQSFNVFDFLRDIVSRVPDYSHGHGHGHSEAGADDRSLPKRRKATGDDLHDSDEESKRSKMHELSHTGGGSTGRGRGRGRGRARGRGARTVEGETYHQEVESEPCTSVQQNSKHDPSPNVVTQNSKNDPNPSVAVDSGPEAKEIIKENIAVTDEGTPSVRNIDLNTNLNGNEDKNASTGAKASLPESAVVTKHKEYPAWPLSDVDKMAINPMHLADLGRRMDEDEEDYDEEG